MKKVFVLVLVACLSLLLTSCNETQKGQNESSVTRSVIDMSGYESVIPGQIESYAVAWAGLMDIVTMFDGIDHLVAYPEKSASFKCLFNVYPRLSEKVCLPNEGISVETVIDSGAQVVFLKKSDDEALVERLRECGIITIDCEFKDYEGLKEVVKIISEVLNNEGAKEKAEEYCSYIDESVKYVQKITNKIPDDEKISALVIKDTKDYSAYGSTRYTGKWVEMCGAKYSMVNEDTYANIKLTKEQLLEYNPDVLFFAMPGQAEQFLKDDTWKNMKAVKNGTVYNNPSGFNTWSNSGAESAMQFKWALSKLYPELIDYNIKDEVKNFYYDFYGYSPSEIEIEKILSGSFN